MFAKSIIGSDAFLDMPLSTQALYLHRWMHNYLYKDRYKETTYINEKAQIYLTQTKAYTEKNIACEQNVNRLLTECIHNDNKMLTQVSIGKDSIDKDIDKKKYKRKRE